MSESVAMNTFLDNLEKAVAFAGLQWKDVAIKAGMTPQALSDVRNERRSSIGFERGERIAKAIGIPLYMLLYPKFNPQKHMKKRRKVTAA